MGSADPSSAPATAPPVLIITGPTAGGKAAFAGEVAAHFGVPILSLDSMKVYRGMNIGTAKPTPAQIRDIPVKLVDLREPWESFSIGDYLRELASLAPSLKAPWVICGGTPFYLHALISGINPGPPPDHALRGKYLEEARAMGVEALHAKLSTSDADSARDIHPHDLKRIVRALEVRELAGEPLSVVKKKKRPFLPDGSYRIIGFRRPRLELYRRIDARVTQLFDAGWVEEVEGLIRAHDPPWGAEASQSIGYQLIRAALEKGEDPRGCLPLIQQRTRHFARSQLTWFRKMPIAWWPTQEREKLLPDLERSVEAYSAEGAMPPLDAARALPEED